jgi:hypothetical protein
LFTVYFPASKNCNCELALKNSKTPNWVLNLLKLTNEWMQFKENNG